MNFKRITTMILVAAMLAGVVSGCKKVPDEVPTSSSTEATTVEIETTTNPDSTEVTQAPLILDGYSQLPLLSTNDASDTVDIYSWNNELSSLIDTYSDINYNYTVYEEYEYYECLDQAFADGNAPDLFVCDSEHAREYAINGQAMPVNSVGISNSELTGMFDSTLRNATDNDGVIRGLAYAVEPVGIFYNRDLALEYLGVEEPADVQAFFADWDSFLSTARNVNTASEGEVRLIGGPGELETTFLAQRTTPWVDGTTVSFDDAMSNYLEVSQSLALEELTFNSIVGSPDWQTQILGDQVIACYATLDDMRRVMINAPTGEEAPNWGLVDTPSATCVGTAFIMVSSTCDMTASCAKILRDIAINNEALEAMAASGMFVNSSAVMNEIASDVNYTYEWLVGQNPIVILLNDATNASSLVLCANEAEAMSVYHVVAESFLTGDITSISDAENSYIAVMEEHLGIV